MPATATKRELLIILEALRAELGLVATIKMPVTMPVIEKWLGDIDDAIKTAREV